MHWNVHEVIHQYGYVGIFLALALEIIGIPFPGETILTISGIHWMKGNLSFIFLIFFAVSGNVLGSSVSYLLGRYLGRTVLLHYGKWIGVTHERLEKVEQKFTTFRFPLIFVGKYVAGIRVVVAYLAGIDRMPYPLFFIYNSMGALAWVLTYVLFGKYLILLWQKCQPFLRSYPTFSIIAVVLSLGLLIGYIKRKKRKNKEHV